MTDCGKLEQVPDVSEDASVRQAHRMDIHFIPFHGQVLVYRPLRRLALVANAALARHIRAHLGSGRPTTDSAAARFLDSIDFWAPDPSGPVAWRPGDRYSPTTAVLLMTNACNLRCVYCYARGGEGQPQAMSLPLARQVIDTIVAHTREAGRERFSLAFHGGGEPTLNPQTLEGAILHARSQDLPCDISLASNGVWSPAIRDLVLEHMDHLSISVDGTGAVQDTQRPRADGGASSAAVMASIAALDATGVEYGLRMTVTMENLPSLPESVAFLCREAGCPAIQVEPSFAARRGGCHGVPDRDEADAFVRAFMAAFEVAESAGKHLFYSGARPWLVTPMFCRAPQTALIVTPEGDVVTCFETCDRRHPLTPQFTVGHATPDAVTIDQEALKAFMSRQTSHRETCRHCPCFWHCGGDCATRCTAADGGRQGRCRVNRTLTRELLGWYIAEAGGVWRGEMRRPQRREAVAAEDLAAWEDIAAGWPA